MNMWKNESHGRRRAPATDGMECAELGLSNSRQAMRYPSYIEAVRRAPVMLTDGGIETRLIYQDHLKLPDFASFLPLFDPSARPMLAALYRSYLYIAGDTGLPMQIGTPTWRAHPDGLARQGFTAADDLHRVNAAAVALLRDLRQDSALQASSSSPASSGRVTMAITRRARRRRAKPATITARKPRVLPSSASNYCTHRPSPAPPNCTASPRRWRRPACPTHWLR